MNESGNEGAVFRHLIIWISICTAAMRSQRCNLFRISTRSSKIDCKGRSLNTIVVLPNSGKDSLCIRSFVTERNEWKWQWKHRGVQLCTTEWVEYPSTLLQWDARKSTSLVCVSAMSSEMNCKGAALNLITVLSLARVRESFWKYYFSNILGAKILWTIYYLSTTSTNLGHKHYSHMSCELRYWFCCGAADNGVPWWKFYSMPIFGSEWWFGWLGLRTTLLFSIAIVQDTATRYRKRFSHIVKMQ